MQSWLMLMESSVAEKLTKMTFIVLTLNLVVIFSTSVEHINITPTVETPVSYPIMHIICFYFL